MKKRNRRQSGIAGLPLAPNEVDKLFMSPRIHLELLLTGLADSTHLETIAGVLNLGSGLAVVKENEQLATEIAQGVEVLSAAAKASPPQLAAHHRQPFIALIAKIETETRKAPRKTLIAAMSWVRDTLDNGGVEVRQLDGSVVSKPPHPQTGP